MKTPWHILRTFWPLRNNPFIGGLCLALVCLGCASPKPVDKTAVLLPPPVKAHATRAFTAQSFPPVARLSWQTNYTPPPPGMVEMTVIERCTDLRLQDWQMVFVGATNECVVPRLWPVEFYRAGNLFTNT